MDEYLQLSERAFVPPHWQMTSSIDLVLKNILGLRSKLFEVRESGKLCGFGVGTLIDSEAVRFFGFDECGASSGDYCLSWLAVEPQYQGRGIGRLLTALRIQHAESQGASAVFFETVRTNHSVIACHQQLGFRLRERRAFAGGGRLHESNIFYKVLTRLPTRAQGA